MKKNQMSPALSHVDHVWKNVRSGSHSVLNQACYSALQNAIESGMHFDESDLRTLSNNYRSAYWLSGGGEGLYGKACGDSRGSLNVSAAISFEKHFDRPAWLWAEDSKSPSRLHVGARFTWQGHFVTVTSFKDEEKSLIACSYTREHEEKHSPGEIIYALGKYRRIELVKEYADGTTCARYSGPVPTRGSGAFIDRRFTITHAELMAARKGYDKLRRSFEKEIAAATTLEALDAVAAKIGMQGTTSNAYRHFDLDILRAAVQNRRRAIEEQQSAEEYRVYEQNRNDTMSADLERWIAGEDVRRHFDTIRVRIRDNRVEVSNGNSVTLEGARSALAFALKHRAKGWSENGETFDVDAFKINRIDPKDGVTIGCTHFDWSEIERFKDLLKS